MLCHARYSLAPDADNAVHPADGVIAQKDREAGVLAVFFGRLLPFMGTSKALQAVEGAGFGGFAHNPWQNRLWNCLQEKSS